MKESSAQVLEHLYGPHVCRLKSLRPANHLEPYLLIGFKTLESLHIYCAEVDIHIDRLASPNRRNEAKALSIGEPFHDSFGGLLVYRRGGHRLGVASLPARFLFSSPIIDVPPVRSFIAHRAHSPPTNTITRRRLT